jgi:hypothetical protein
MPYEPHYAVRVGVRLGLSVGVRDLGVTGVRVGLRLGVQEVGSWG